jgi:hypothetical protein
MPSDGVTAVPYMGEDNVYNYKKKNKGIYEGSRRNVRSVKKGVVIGNKQKRNRESGATAGR